MPITKTIASVSPKKRTARYAPRTKRKTVEEARAESLAVSTPIAQSFMATESPKAGVSSEPLPPLDAVLTGPWTVMFMDLERSCRIDPGGGCALYRYLALAFARINTESGHMKSLNGDPMGAFVIDGISRKNWTIYAHLTPAATTMTLSLGDPTFGIGQSRREILVEAPREEFQNVHSVQESGLALI